MKKTTLPNGPTPGGTGHKREGERMTTTTNQTRQATVADGIYCAKGGDGRLAERDRFMRLYLTVKGGRIYTRAVRQYEASEDEDELARQVQRAIAAGY